MKLPITLLSIIAAGILSTNAAGPCDELSALIDRTYNFKPSKLSAEQQNTKAVEMDKVWNLVENGPKEMIPCLRTEIRARTGDSFFRFNASNLVYKHDQSLESKHLLIDAYAGVDFGDINLRYWLPYMAELGREGLDVSKPGETWIRFSNPLYYLPQHGTRPVDKGVGALALFGSMDESIATPVLSKLASEEGADFRSIVIWLLINQATPESDAEVKKLAAKLQKPLADRVLNEVANPKRIVPREGTEKTSRVVIIKALEDLLADKPGLWMKLVADVPDGERDMAKELTEKELTLLRKVRRMYAANATPHSPIWYSTFTQVINTIRLKAAGTSSVK